MKSKKGEKTRAFFDDLRITTRRYRIANGLSQYALAQKIGASGPSLSNFESGTSLLREQPLERLILLVRGVPAIFADRCRNLAEGLDSPDTTDRIKVQNFFDELTKLQMHTEAIIAERNK